MKQTIHLGHFGGIPIGANWSVVVIVALITWVLAAGVLPDLAPGEPAVAYAGVAAVAALLFFASLVTHELAHSLLARRFGVTVRGITLWMFGGVSELEAEMSSAGEEFKMAVAGPATSLGLGGFFLGASVLAAAVSLPDLVIAALWWLGVVNIGLGVFNLLPAYPMDGGRVLRAVLWTRSGDRTGPPRRRPEPVTGSPTASSVSVCSSPRAVPSWRASGSCSSAGTSKAPRARRPPPSSRRPFSGSDGPTSSCRLTRSPCRPRPPSSTSSRPTSSVATTRRSRWWTATARWSGSSTSTGCAPWARPTVPSPRSERSPGRWHSVPVVAPGDTGSEVAARMTAERSTRALVVDPEQRLVGIITSTDLARAIDVGAPGGSPTGNRPG